MKAAQGKQRRLQRELDKVTQALKGGVKKGERPKLRARQQRLKADVSRAKQVTSKMQSTLGRLQDNKLHALVGQLRRYPQLKNLRSALRQLETAQKNLSAFFKKVPSARVAARYLSVIGVASQEATYSAWMAELVANLLRELRRPPAGCPELFEAPIAPSVASSASVLATAAAKPAFEPLVAPVANLPPALTGGKLPSVARSLKRQLAALAAHVPAVHVGLLERGRSNEARTALKRTLPRLRALLTSVGSLRPKLAGALRIGPRTISRADLSKYRLQARAGQRFAGSATATRPAGCRPASKSSTATERGRPGAMTRSRRSRTRRSGRSSETSRKLSAR